MAKEGTKKTKRQAEAQAQEKLKLTREEWLARGLEAIGRLGRGPRSIDELVEAVGVTKGSFYWHFKDREDFVASAAAYWVEELTSSVPSKVNALGGPAEERLLLVAEVVTMAERAKYDVAMHAWALREPAVAKAVAEAERIRLDFVRSLFAEMGFEGDELEMRTRTFVVFYSFELGLREQLSEEERTRLVKLRHEMLVRK